MHYYLKIINVFFLATVKFFYTPIYGFVLGLNLLETMIATLAGGLVGFVFFYNLSSLVIFSARFVKPFLRKIIPESLKNIYRIWKIKRKSAKKNRKKFSRKNRFIIKIRTTYGKWGIMLLTPVLLSIPLGAFLLRKYYSQKPNTVILALLAIAFEGIVITLVFWLIPVDFIHI